LRAVRASFPGRDADAPLAVVTRGGRVESWHRGLFVVVRGDEIVVACGDPATPVYCRSATKPIQALPLVELGIAERAGLSDAELAVICASHFGSGEHLRAVASILHKGGFGEEHLQCGPHPPRDPAARDELARSGAAPRRIHNNCSGKHAGFLHLAAGCGEPPARHLDPDSAGQRLVRRTLVELAGLDEREVEVAIDGCGAPTFAMPLVGLARAFRRFANPDRLPPVRAAACRRLLAAIARAPSLFQGRGGLCTALVEAAPGRILPKNGAEGVFAIGLPELDLGLAVKVADGAERGYQALVVEALHRFGLWPEVPPALEPFRRALLHNTQGREIGAVLPVVELPS
jgi:L-asparaginase II